MEEPAKVNYLQTVENLTFQNGKPVLDRSLLPNEKSVLDHLHTVLDKESHSFEPYIGDTLQIVNTNATDTNDINVRTLIFGVSSVKEAKEFVRSFNNHIDDFEKRHCFPPFYHFEVLFVKPFEDYQPKIIDQRGEYIEDLSVTAIGIPARVVFGTTTDRWDMIFNLDYTYLNRDTFEADYFLVRNQDPLGPYWATILHKLHGIATSYSLEKTLPTLMDFMQTAYTFQTCDKQAELRHIDLRVLLAFAGWNFPDTNPSSLDFIFTGTTYIRKQEFICGRGRWAVQSPLQPELNRFLQRECITTLTTVLLSSLTWMIHWIPTPAIAAITTRKEPIKFIRWFKDFECSVLSGAYLHDQITPRKDPAALIRKVKYKQDNKIFLSPESIAQMVPTWPSVTNGGVLTDLMAIDHILFKIHPNLNVPGVKQHLRWESNPSLIYKALTGQDQPTGKYDPERDDQGVSLDKGILDIPEIMVQVNSDEHEVSVIKAYETYQTHCMKKDDKAKDLTPTQLAILHAWRYPFVFLQLIDKSSKYYSTSILYTLHPLAMAYSGSIEIHQPKLFVKFRKLNHTLYDMVRFNKAMELASSQDKTIQLKAQQKMKILHKKLQKSIGYPTMTMDKLKKYVANWKLRMNELDEDFMLEDQDEEVSVTQELDLEQVNTLLETDEEVLEMDINSQEMDIFL